MRKLPVTVQASTSRNIIYAGTPIKNGAQWGANKTDVTIEALVAVSEHVLKFGEPVILKADGVESIKITVERLDSPKEAPHG